LLLLRQWCICLLLLLLLLLRGRCICLLLLLLRWRCICLLLLLLLLRRRLMLIWLVHGTFQGCCCLCRLCRSQHNCLQTCLVTRLLLLLLRLG
jgi:hypothetical protein